MSRAYRWVRERVFSGAGRAPSLDPHGVDLVAVAAGYDDVESCGAALERGAAGSPPWRADRQALLRHPLVLPVAAIAEVAAVCAQEGYVPVEPIPPIPERVDLAEGQVLLVLARSQLLDPLHCAQERSRMAGLAQRHGGRALGWDGLQQA